MSRYIVKCDTCKKTIRKTNKVVESYQGGLCKECRYSLLPKGKFDMRAVAGNVIRKSRR